MLALHYLMWPQVASSQNWAQLAKTSPQNPFGLPKHFTKHGEIRNRREGGGWLRYVFCDSRYPKSTNKEQGHGSGMEVQMKRTGKQ